MRDMALKLTAMAVLFTAMLISLPSMAQQNLNGSQRGGCPGGSAPVDGSCGSPSNARSDKKTALPEVWQNRYGALAASAPGSIIGVAQGQHSERAARKLAMRKCVGPACRIVIEFRNSCGSAAWGPGNSGRMTYGTEPDSGGAEQEALRRCHDAGGGVCETVVSTCSLPVRVQ